VGCPECHSTHGEYCINKKGMMILTVHKSRANVYRHINYRSTRRKDNSMEIIVNNVSVCTINLSPKDRIAQEAVVSIIKESLSLFDSLNDNKIVIIVPKAE
jgi:hypothetical protein